MNRKEAALSKCIVDAWSTGFGDQLFRACGLTSRAPGIRANVRVPATDIAWRELDLLSGRFELGDESCRLIVELKNGGIGYGSIGQVMFYKHVLVPRHLKLLGASRFIFAVIGEHPNPKRWYGDGVLESDAVAFLDLFAASYWPDPDVHAFSYRELGLAWSGSQQAWSWNIA